MLEFRWTMNFQMFKLDLEKAEEPEIKLSTFIESERNQGISRKNLLLLHQLCWSLWLWITTNCGKFLKRWEQQTTLPVSWETCMRVKKQHLELDMKQQTGSKLGKEYVKAVYGHPVYLTYIQSESESESCSVMSDSLQPHGLYSPWNSLGQNTGLGSLSLLQGIFPTQGLNPGLPCCRQILYQLSHKRSARILEWVAYPFSSRSYWPRNRTGVSCIAGRFFTNWVKSTSCKMPGWMNHKMESGLPGEIPTTSDMQMIPMRVGLWRKLSAEELMLSNCGVGEDSWESLGLQGDPTSPFWRRSALGFLGKEWC